MTTEPHPLATQFPTMNDKDFSALVDDIKAHGQREPIVVFQGAILDGRHRAKACALLGIEPTYRTFDGDEAAAALLAKSLNVHRRHLTREQRRELIDAELKRDPSQSDRSIAEKVGVDHVTVGGVRRSLVDGGEIHHLEKRVGKDGVAQAVAAKPVRLNKRGRKLATSSDRRLAVDRAPEIMALAQAGHNVEQIAKAQGIDIQWVKKIMDQHGIKVAIPRSATKHADATRVANGAVDALLGAAQGLALFRTSGLRVSADTAKALLPDLRSALKTLRWFEQQLKDAANG